MIFRFLAFAAIAAAQVPDLTGIWSSSTATPLERPAQFKDKAFFTKEEAADWESRAAARSQESATPAPTGASVGTYNTAFWEYGQKLGGSLRTSIITDP